MFHLLMDGWGPGRMATISSLSLFLMAHGGPTKQRWDEWACRAAGPLGEPLAAAGNAINNFTFLFMKKKSLLLIGLQPLRWLWNGPTLHKKQSFLITGCLSLPHELSFHYWFHEFINNSIPVHCLRSIKTTTSNVIISFLLLVLI